MILKTADKSSMQLLMKEIEYPASDWLFAKQRLAVEEHLNKGTAVL